MPIDSIMADWLAKQKSDAEALDAASNSVDISAIDDHRYLVKFSCIGLVKTEAGDIVEADEFLVGIAFPDDYLRRFNPAKTIHLFHPADVFHPNVKHNGICVGRMYPGTELLDLVQQVFNILTFKSMNLNDPLNVAAAEWARDHKDRFPIDRRPLKMPRLNPESEMRRS